MADRDSQTADLSSEASPTPNIAAAPRMLILWDLPLRLFHWMLVILVVSAVITVNIGGDAMVWHGQIGRLVLALLSFRLVWGVIGGHYARFRQFPLSPAKVRAYLKGQWQGQGHQPRGHNPLGHNPLGAWSVLAMLAVLLGFAVSGPFIGDDAAYLGPLVRAVDDARSAALHAWHESMQWPLYLLVSLHIAAIVFYQRRGKDLLGPMRHGRIPAPTDSSDQPHSPVAARPWAVILALLIAAGVWWWSGGSWLPEPTPPPAAFDW